MSRVGDFDAEQVRMIIEGGAKNDQIYNSLQFSPLIEKLRSRELFPGAEFDALLLDNDLEDLVSTPTETKVRN